MSDDKVEDQKTEVTEGEGAPATPPPVVEEPAAAPPPWATGRIDELTRSWREEERKHRETRTALDLAQRTIDELRKGKPGPALPEEEIERRAESKAEIKAQMIAWNRACDEVHRAGTKKFPDFQERINNFNNLGGLNNEKGFALVQAVMEAAPNREAQAQLLYDLGKDLNKASHIMSLPPLQMAVAVAKAAGVAPPAPSGAPDPIPQPTRGRGVKAEASLFDENLSTKDWIKLREAQLKAANG